MKVKTRALQRFRQHRCDILEIGIRKEFDSCTSFKIKQDMKLLDNHPHHSHLYDTF